MGLTKKELVELALRESKDFAKDIREYDRARKKII